VRGFFPEQAQNIIGRHMTFNKIAGDNSRVTGHQWARDVMVCLESQNVVIGY
jgi:hypothetical protein